MKKLKLMNYMRTGGLQSFKVNARPSSLAFLHGKKRQSADNAFNVDCILFRLMFIYWKDFADASFKVNKLTVEWTFWQSLNHIAEDSRGLPSSFQD